MIKNLIKHTLWLVACCLISLLLWLYIAIKLYIDTGFFALLIAYFIGIKTALSYRRETAFFYWLYAGFTSVTFYWLGTYLIYAYYHGVAQIEDDLSVFTIAFRIIANTTSETVGNFALHHITNFGFFNFLWPTLTFIIALVTARRVVSYKQQWRKFKKMLNK